MGLRSPGARVPHRAQPPASAGGYDYLVVMRAMLLEQQAPIESSPLKLRDVADPIPGAGEVRIRVSCCAICRTDLHIIEGDLPMEKRPVVPGHQIVGIVD